MGISGKNGRKDRERIKKIDTLETSSKGKKIPPGGAYLSQFFRLCAQFRLLLEAAAYTCPPKHKPTNGGELLIL